MATKIAAQALIITLLITPLLDAGCGVYFNYQKVVAVPVAVYQVGEGLERRAEAIKAMRDYGVISPDAKPVKDGDQYVTPSRSSSPPSEKPKPVEPSGDLRGIAPLSFSKCARCHTGKGEAVEYWDMDKGLSSDQFLAITDMVANKTNVPAKMEPVISGLKPEEYGKLLDEFIKLAKAKPSTIAKKQEVSPLTY